jgi:hypothetical protein
MKISINQPNATSHIVTTYQQDEISTGSMDDDTILQTIACDDDDEIEIALNPGQYVRIDPVEAE